MKTLVLTLSLIVGSVSATEMPVETVLKGKSVEKVNYCFNTICCKKLFTTGQYYCKEVCGNFCPVGWLKQI